MQKLSGRLTAEFIGTFALIYFGCGAAINRTLGGGEAGFLAVGLVHAIVLGVMITATMNVSGGHLNPAVTLGLLSVRRIDARSAAAYVAVQLLGGVLGALVLKLTIPTAVHAIGTMATPALANSVSFANGIIIEALLTFFLMSAVMGTAVAADAPRVGGFAIGLVLFFDIMVGGSFTGAAMNPARAFGPALVSGTWYAQPVWWIGPILGSIVAAQVWERVILKQ
jgi:MIP family channel proteins